MKRLLILILLAGPVAAQKANRARKKPAAAKTETPAEAVNTPSTGDPEMAAVRGIQVRTRAIYADLCRLVLLQRGEYSRFRTDTERCQRLAELGILKTGDTDIYKTPVTLGTVAKAAIYAHNLERSLMFRLTGFSWYALQTAEALGLIEEGLNASDEISGAELMQILDEAQNLAEEKAGWNKPENPYREFGYETYEEMYQNPAGAAKINPK